MTTVAQQPIASIPLKFLVWVVTYVINEIKETDTYSGGHTDISIINKDGYLNISKDTILKHYDEGIQMICKGLSQSFKNKTLAEKFLRGMFPRP